MRREIIMWRKRILLFVLCFLMVAVVACQKGQDSETESAAVSSEETERETEPDTTEVETPEETESETPEEVLEPLDAISLAELNEMSGEECLQMLKRVGYELPDLGKDKELETEIIKQVLYGLSVNPYAHGAYGWTTLCDIEEEVHEVLLEFDPDYPGAYGPDDPGFALNLEEMVNLSGAECFDKLQLAGYHLPKLDMKQEDLEGMLKEVLVELYHDPSEYGSFSWTEMALMKKKLHKIFLAYDPNYPDAYIK